MWAAIEPSGPDTLIGMHLVHSDRRVLEGERVCEAIANIGPAENLVQWANRFALLSDPTRLALLLAIDRAGPISVTDLAVAANANDTTVSRALRLLRATAAVRPVRDGRVIRYELADARMAPLLAEVRERQSSGHSAGAT
jgi:DNA-binding transcriptional ArsR family regulator